MAPQSNVELYRFQCWSCSISFAKWRTEGIFFHEVS